MRLEVDADVVDDGNGDTGDDASVDVTAGHAGDSDNGA